MYLGLVASSNGQACPHTCAHRSCKTVLALSCSITRSLTHTSTVYLNVQVDIESNRLDFSVTAIVLIGFSNGSRTDTVTQLLPTVEWPGLLQASTLFTGGETTRRFSLGVHAGGRMNRLDSGARQEALAVAWSRIGWAVRRMHHMADRAVRGQCNAAATYTDGIRFHGIPAATAW